MKKKIKRLPFPKTYECQKVVKDNIDRIFYLMDYNIINEFIINSSLISMFNIQNINLFKLFVNEFNFQEYNRSGMFTVFHPNIPSQLLFTLELNANTLDNTTLLKIILNIKDYNFNGYNLKELVEGFNNLCSELISKIINFLNISNKLLYQTESIVIDCQRELIWEYINSKCFIGFFQNIQEIKYIDENHFEFIIFNNKITATIVKSNCNENEKKWKKVLSFDSKDFLKCTITLEIIKLDEKKTFLSVTHKFLDHINYNGIQLIGFKKTKLLKYIKDIFEKNDKSNVEEKKIYDDNNEEKEEEEFNSNTNDEKNSLLSPEENFQFLLNNLKNISSDK